MRATLPARALVIVALCLVFACKRESDRSSTAPDAAIAAPEAPLEVEDPELGLQLRLPAAWKISAAGKDEHHVLDARRRPRPGTSFMVAPRIVVSRSPSDEDVDSEVSRVLDELKTLGKQPGIKLLQTSTGLRQAGRLELREVTVHYEVGAGQAGSGQGLVQRTFVGKHLGRDGRMYTIEITTSGLSEDQELLGTEVDTMLSGLSFVGVEVAAPTAEGRPGESPEP